MFGPTVPQFTETYFHKGGEKYQCITCTSYIVYTCCVCRTCTRTASQLSIPTYMFNQWLACPFVIYASRRTNIFYVLHVIQEHYWNPQKIQELTTAWNLLTFRTLDPAWMLPNKMTNLLCVLILSDVNLRFLPFFWAKDESPTSNICNPSRMTWNQTTPLRIFSSWKYSWGAAVEGDDTYKDMNPGYLTVTLDCFLSRNYFSEYIYIYTYLIFISTHIYIYCTYDYLRVYGVPVLDIAHLPGKGSISFLRVYVSLRSQQIFMI